MCIHLTIKVVLIIIVLLSSLHLPPASFPPLSFPLPLFLSLSLSPPPLSFSFAPPPSHQYPGLPNDVDWRCDKLKKLDLSHNRLRALPDTFQDLRRMVALNVSYNHLKEIPQSCSWGCVNLVSQSNMYMYCTCY